VNYRDLLPAVLKITHNTTSLAKLATQVQQCLECGLWLDG